MIWSYTEIGYMSIALKYETNITRKATSILILCE